MKLGLNLVGIGLAVVWCVVTLGGDIVDGEAAAIVLLLFALMLPAVGVVEATRRRRRGDRETADALLTAALLGAVTVAFVVAIGDERLDRARAECGAGSIR